MAITSAESMVRQAVFTRPGFLRPNRREIGHDGYDHIRPSRYRPWIPRPSRRKRVDLVATKSRCRKHTTDNHGGFQLVDPCRHAVVIGSKYNLSAKDVIEFCTKHVGND